jgi:hypothetical protein
VENKLSLPKVKNLFQKPLSGDDKCSGCIWGHPVIFCYRNRHREREREPLCSWTGTRTSQFTSIVVGHIHHIASSDPS